MFKFNESGLILAYCTYVHTLRKISLDVIEYGYNDNKKHISRRYNQLITSTWSKNELIDITFNTFLNNNQIIVSMKNIDDGNSFISQSF